MGPLRQAKRWAAFGQSIFSTYTREAQKHDAVNLAQGFPDFPGPAALIEDIKAALSRGHNQYAPGSGLPCLREVLAERESSGWPRSDEGGQIPERGFLASPEDILVTAGATEGLFCSLVGLVDPGDRVLAFEPFYESYRQCTAAAGGCFETVHLLSPDHPSAPQGQWGIDWDHFEQVTREPFRVFVVNTPHNPTGLVLGFEEWELILGACRRHGAVIISDEVYENLVYEPGQHVSVLDVANQSDRILKVSSISKSFGFTGLKVGWIVGKAPDLEGPAKVHEATLFCLPTALQDGVARFLGNGKAVGRFLSDQLSAYALKRQRLYEGLQEAGLSVSQLPFGTYFLTVNGFGLSRDGMLSDKEVAARLIAELGVAALPISGFCNPAAVESQSGVMRWATARADHPLHRGHWLRFSFCKQDAVLESAIRRLTRV